MTTQLTSIIEHQARRHIIAIADEMGWNGELIRYDWFAPACTPRLATILTAAHEFKRTHRSVSQKAEVSVLRVLANILIHVFPQPTWEGTPLRPITSEFNEAWNAAQDVLSQRWDEVFDYENGLIECGISIELAHRAAMIRLFGGPENNEDRKVVRWVAALLRNNGQ